MKSISGKARSHLRALGHHLKPVVQIGKEGLTPSVVAASQMALATHELIKVRLGDNVEADRYEVSASLAESTKSELVGQIGRTLLLYRRHPSQPKIALPGAKAKRPSAPAKPAQDVAAAS